MFLRPELAAEIQILAASLAASGNFFDGGENFVPHPTHPRRCKHGVISQLRKRWRSPPSPSATSLLTMMRLRTAPYDGAVSPIAGHLKC
ncbi:hypothetical protein L484_019854 [Morus notabilis]|uniref:Uncharacterized protein n=1 Tax=Morus notabilis TaxID=981085 RepID=W9SY40_9ROSA|nr:hypothetical protein L484_019854 [Morus notabilis]